MLNLAIAISTQHSPHKTKLFHYIMSLTTMEANLLYLAIRACTLIIIACMHTHTYTCIHMHTRAHTATQETKKGFKKLIDKKIKRTSNVLMPQWRLQGLVHTECTAVHDCWQLFTCMQVTVAINASCRFVHSSRTVGVSYGFSNTMRMCTIWACACSLVALLCILANFSKAQWSNHTYSC